MPKRKADDLVLLMQDFNMWSAARGERTHSREHKLETRTLENLTRRIRAIMERGDIEQSIAALQIAQQMNWKHLSRDEKDQGRIQNDMNSFKTGLSDYRILRDEPKKYLNTVAPGYRDSQDMVSKKLRVPKDSLQRALKSHISHIDSRRSPHLQQAERDLIDAQKALAVSIQNAYSAMQKDLLERE